MPLKEFLLKVSIGLVIGGLLLAFEFSGLRGAMLKVKPTTDHDFPWIIIWTLIWASPFIIAIACIFTQGIYLFIRGIFWKD